MDKGSQTVTNFFVTTDKDINPATNTPVVPAVAGKCNPFFGVLTDSVGSTGETKTINLIGTSCKKITGISKNSSGNDVGDTLNGGWGIEASPAHSPAVSGWGTVSGSTTSSDNVSIKLMGTVTQ
jgi:hypothetical protein